MTEEERRELAQLRERNSLLETVVRGLLALIVDKQLEERDRDLILGARSALQGGNDG